MSKDGGSSERTVPTRLDLIILLGGSEPNLWRLLCHENFLAAATRVTISIGVASRSTDSD